MVWAIQSADLRLHCQCHGWASRNNTASCDSPDLSIQVIYRYQVYKPGIFPEYQVMYPTPVLQSFG
jgi:hypothetical protein